jgi:hypothetical protein
MDNVDSAATTVKCVMLKSTMKDTTNNCLLTMFGLDDACIIGGDISSANQTVANQ